MRILEWLEQLFEAKARIQINRTLELPSLHQAVLDNNISEVRLCLHHKANVNEQYIKNDRTALHYAAEAGNKEILEILLQYKATINIKDRNGDTPFDLAHSTNQIEIEKLLSENKEYVFGIGEVKIIENDIE